MSSGIERKKRNQESQLITRKEAFIRDLDRLFNPDSISPLRPFSDKLLSLKNKISEFSPIPKKFLAIGLALAVEPPIFTMTLLAKRQFKEAATTAGTTIALTAGIPLLIKDSTLHKAAIGLEIYLVCGFILGGIHAISMVNQHLEDR